MDLKVVAVEGNQMGLLPYVGLLSLPLSSASIDQCNSLACWTWTESPVQGMAGESSRSHLLNYS